MISPLLTHSFVSHSKLPTWQSRHDASCSDTRNFRLQLSSPVGEACWGGAEAEGEGGAVAGEASCWAEPRLGGAALHTGASLPLQGPASGAPTSGAMARSAQAVVLLQDADDCVPSQMLDAALMRRACLCCQIANFCTALSLAEAHSALWRCARS